MYLVKQCAQCPYKPDDVGLHVSPDAQEFLCADCPSARRPELVIRTGKYPREVVREPAERDRAPYAGSPAAYLW